MKLIKNYFYNTSYQLLAIILPLITGPYVSRVLGPHGVGINSYTYTIANWFVLLGSIGVALYGSRQIAYVRNNKEALSITFWEIFIMKCLTMSIALIVYLLYIIFIGRYKQYQFVQLSYVISASLDISWLFMGIEDFKKTVIRNTLVKVVSLIAILLFIKSRTDLLNYIGILALSTLIGNLTLWPFLKKILTFVPISSLKPFRHLKGAISLFLPLAAIQLYTSLNKILLGALTSTTDSGFYDKTDSIIRMTLTLATSLATVMLPHTSEAFSEGNFVKVRLLLYKSFNFITFISMGLMFGVAGISLKFGLFFYGKGFQPVGTSMLLESVVILFISWASISGNQYLIPTNQISIYTKSVFFGALVNIVLIVPLIKLFGLNGAILATDLSEISVTMYQIVSIKNQISYKKLFKDFGKCSISGLLMFIIVFVINQRLSLTVITLFYEVIIGLVVYIICSFIIKTAILQQILTFLKIHKKV